MVLSQDLNLFLKDASTYAKDNKLFIGHLHTEIYYENVFVIDTFQNNYSYIEYKDSVTNEKYLIFADCHFYVNDNKTDLMQKELLTIVKKKKPNKIIFLGDTVDLLKAKNLTNMFSFTYFLEQLKDITKHLQIIIIKGNHDWRIEEYLYPFKNVFTCAKYRVNNSIFMHGHQFDPQWNSGVLKYWKYFGDLLDPINKTAEYVYSALLGVYNKAKGWLYTNILGRKI